MGIQDDSTLMRGALSAVCLASKAGLPLRVARPFLEVVSKPHLKKRRYVMGNLFINTCKQFTWKKQLFKLAGFLFVLIYFSLSAQAAVDEVFVIVRKGSAPDVYPDVFVKAETRTDYSYDYDLYQVSFDVSAGDYLGFSLGFDNYTDSPGSVLYDKIELTGPSGAVAIPNSGFEQGTTGWKKNCPSSAISTFELSADAYEGLKAANLTVNNASNGMFCAIRNSTNIAIAEAGTYTLSLYAKVIKEEFLPDEIFAFEVGNQWVYDSGGKNRVTDFSPSIWWENAYEVELFENDVSQGKEYYEPFKGQLFYRGFEDIDGSFNFQNGLAVAWFPASVGDRKVSSTGVVGYIGTITMTVDVLALEQLTLGFGTVNAYKLRHKATVQGPGGKANVTYYWWYAPYLGIVKMQSGAISQQLISFAIGGGDITEDTDTDGDGLKDFEEMSVYNTDRQDTDSDDDGLTDGEEVNTYGTDPNSTDSDNDGLDDGDEVNTHGTDPANEDTDSDGLTDGDEVNIHNTDPNDEDTDDDELNDGDEIAIGTDPNNSDTDGDGMPDGWEDAYDLDPLTDDAGDDPDGDNLTNLEEYQKGRHPTNVEPDAPVLLLPDDAETDVLLKPQLQTDNFSDTDGHGHGLTRWQIGRRIGNPEPCSEESFTNADYIVFDGTCGGQLTLFNVPDFLLDADTDYCWRARFTDTGDATSDWSEPFAFKTIAADENDQNQNGIPDDQEVDDPMLDLDDNDVPDVNQPDMKCVNTDGGTGQIGVKQGDNVASIECLCWTDPATIDDTRNKPDGMPMGLVSFRLEVDNPGDIGKVTVYLSEPAPAGAKWYKYDAINGWQDYSAHAVFSPDRTSVELEFKDGGFGDADGVENAIIIDPSGAGVLSAGSGGGGGGGGCFISTMAYGFHMQKGPFALILFLGFLLIGFSELKKKFKK